MPNEYDALLAEQPTPQQALRESMVGAVQQNPDQFAQARQLSEQTGIPAPVVARNLPEVKQRQQLNEYDSLIDTSPKLATQLQDPNFASVAHDDTGTLSGIERTVLSHVGRAMQTQQEWATSPPSLLYGLGGFFRSVQQAGAELLAVPAAGLDTLTGTGSEKLDWWIKHQVDPIVARAPVFQEPTTAPFAHKLMNDIGNLLGTVSLVELTPVAAPGEAATTAEFMRNAITHAAKKMSIPAVTAAINKATEVLQATADPAKAADAAAFEYGAATAFGFGPLSLEGSLVKRMASAPLVTLPMMEATRAAHNVLLPWDAYQPMPSPEDLARQGIVMSILAGFVGPRASMSPLKESIDRVRAQEEALRQAQEAHSTIETLGQLSASGKLRERDPGAFERYIEAVTEDGPVANLYVDAGVLREALQQSGAEGDFRAKMPEAAANMDEMLRIGGDTRIPTHEYAHYIAQTPLDQAILPHLKTDPAAPTMAEAQAQTQAHIDRMTAEAQRVADETGTLNAWRESAATVEREVHAQLEAAGRFSADVNKIYAALTRAGYEVDAAREGITPEQAYIKYALDIASVMGGGKTVPLTKAEAGARIPDSAFNGDTAEAIQRVFIADESPEKLPLKNVGMTDEEIKALEKEGLASGGEMSRAQWGRYDGERSARLAGKTTLTRNVGSLDQRVVDRINEHLGRPELRSAKPIIKQWQDGKLTEAQVIQNLHLFSTKEGLSDEAKAAIRAAIRAVPSAPRKVVSARDYWQNSYYDFLPKESFGNQLLDAPTLAALRRTAADLERPKKGITLRVTENGEAIATGPKGKRVPKTFVRFAQENGLKFMAQRKLPTGTTEIPGNVGEQYGTAMPVDYRAAGALYFNEMGNAFLDRTGRGLFQGEALPAPEDVPEFYSELSRQVDLSGMKSAPAQGWLDWLKSLASKGVKPDEIKWSGIEEFLQAHDGKVTKEEIQDYLDNYGVKVITIIRGEPRKPRTELVRAAEEAGLRRDMEEEGDIEPEYIEPDITWGEWTTDEPNRDYLRERAEERFSDEEDDLRQQHQDDTWEEHVDEAEEELGPAPKLVSWHDIQREAADTLVSLSEDEARALADKRNEAVERYNENVETRARELADENFDEEAAIEKFYEQEEDWYWQDGESPASRTITVTVGNTDYDFTVESAYDETRVYAQDAGEYLSFDHLTGHQRYNPDDAAIESTIIEHLMDQGVSFTESPEDLAARTEQQLQRQLANETKPLPVKWERFVTGKAEEVPGSYREIELMLPPGAVGVPRSGQLWKVMRAVSSDSPNEFVKSFGTEDEARNYAKKLGEPHLSVERSEIETVRKNVPDFYYTTHFPEANIIGHARINEFRGPNDERIMVVQEVQGDWGQQRREALEQEAKYKELDAQIEAKKAEIEAVLEEAKHYTDAGKDAPREILDRHTALTDRLAALRQERDRLDYNRGTPPEGPFIGKTTQWAALVTKRLIRYAVEHGFDKVVWTTGAQQVERWAGGLRQQVDKIEWLKTDKGVQIIASRRGDIRTNTLLREDELSDSIGKAMAQQIIADPNQSGEITGENITVSDTGMAGFYDRMLPNIVNDVLKKLDKSVKVTEIEVKEPPYPLRVSPSGDGTTWVVLGKDSAFYGRFDTELEARKAIEKKEADDKAQNLGTQLGFEISDKIRESAMKALPLFQREGTTPARGQITFGEDITKEPTTIALLQNADLSTFTHELGHFRLQILMHQAKENLSPEAVKDADILLKWLGINDIAAWDYMTLDEQRPYHEKFARGFEAYLFEGKSPSLQMQGIFSRVRAWMIQVYKSLTNLNVTLTPEVRGVMDRLMASEADIKHAQEVRGMQRLFTEKPESMSDAAFAEYQQQDQQATETALAMHQSRSLRDMKWLSGAMSKATRDLQRQAASQRREIAVEAAQLIEQEPIYKAENWLRKGIITNAEGEPAIQTTPEARAGAKLNRAEVEALYPAGDLARPDLSRLAGMLSDTGIHPDLAAEMFGFPSGRDLIARLTSMTPRKEAIQGLTDQLMLERHGEMSNPEAIQRSAEAAVHNELRARVIANEWRTLGRIQGSAAQLNKAAAEIAEQTIAARTIKDVRPKLYEANEARAARKADDLMKKGDLTGAAEAKRSQLLNNRLAKAAGEALEEVKKAVAHFKKLDKATIQAKMRGEYLDQLNALLARFDMRTSARPIPMDRLPLKEWIDKEAERLSAVMPDLPEWVLNENYKTSYKNLTVAELRGLYDSVRQLEHMARREQQQYMAIRAMQFAEERGAVLAEIRKNWSQAFDAEGEPKGMEPDFVPGLKKTVGRLGDKFAGDFLSPETIYTILGGGKFSVINESLFGRLSTRSDWKSNRLENLYRELKPLFDAYSLVEKYRFGREDIGTGTPANVALTRENALVVALLHGNAEGRERLTNYGWSEVRQKQIIDLLDARDMKLADAIWRMFDENLWPELKALNDRTRGKAPPKVEPRPYETKHGKARGGYFRLKYDTTLDERAHRMDESQAVKELLGGGMGMSAKTNQGSSTERKQNVALRPRLDLGVFSEAVNETVHDLAYREAVADTMRMLNDKGITNAIKQVVGTEGYRTLVRHVRETAAPPRNPSGFIEKTLSIARRNTITTLMSGVKTALQNFTGIASAFVELDANVLGREIGKFYSPQMMDRYNFAMEHSDYMKRRFTSYDRDLQSAAAKLTVKGKLLPEQSTFLALMGMIDKGVAVPVWNAAFKQGMTKFGNDMDKSIQYADHLVRQTQGSGREVDLPAIMSGHGGWGQLKRVFTMFHSYFNGQLNLLVKQGVVSKIEARENPSLASAKFAAKFIAIVAVPAILTEMLMNGAYKEDEDTGDLLMRYAGALVRYVSGFFPLVRDIVPGIWTMTTGEGHYFGAKVSPLDSMYSGLVAGTKSTKDVVTGEADAKDAKNLIMATGYTFGLPGKLVADTVEGTRQWLNDEAGPQAVILGPPKK